MPIHNLIYYRYLFILALALYGSYLFLNGNFDLKSNTGILTVTFLDVGQGDAIFIETPDGFQMLVDGGGDGKVLRSLSEVMSYTDRVIDLLVATHSDKDHIGGLVDVLKRYQVKNVVGTNNQNETEVSSAFFEAVKKEEANVWLSQAGEIWQLGASTTVTVYSPGGDATNWETNASSLVLKVSYGEMDFLLTGDAPVGIENYLVDIYANDLTSEVLKLGHHGSKTSTGESFLHTVNPKFAVVSAGLNNNYGHPNAEVVERVEDFGAELLNTAKSGSLSFVTDGRFIEVRSEK